MKLSEATQILKNRGFLVEFRDSSQEKDREIDDDSQVDGRRSWNNAKARVSGYDNSDTRKEKRVVEKTVNELIEKVKPEDLMEFGYTTEEINRMRKVNMYDEIVVNPQSE